LTVITFSDFVMHPLFL